MTSFCGLKSKTTRLGHWGHTVPFVPQAGGWHSHPLPSGSLRSPELSTHLGHAPPPRQSSLCLGLGQWGVGPRVLTCPCPHARRQGLSPPERGHTTLCELAGGKCHHTGPSHGCTRTVSGYTDRSLLGAAAG